MERTALAIVLFVVTLSAGAACEPGKGAADPSCITGVWGVYLPNPTDPAPNVKLEHFAHASPDDKYGQGVNHDDLMRLHGALQPVAGTAFAASRDAFDVQAEFTLTPDKPATFTMKTNATNTSDPQFTNFYRGAAALKDFHSKRGTVQVLFYYKVAPAAPAK
jgi:hypothetical protein